MPITTTSTLPYLTHELYRNKHKYIKHMELTRRLVKIETNKLLEKKESAQNARNGHRMIQSIRSCLMIISACPN